MNSVNYKNHGKNSGGRALLITGETGCGKTTQCPQFLLEDADARGKGSALRVVVCQPRRIAAIGVANRVAEERGERVGESVGYAIKGESKVHSEKTRLLFCTTAVVLRRMVQDPGLQGIDYIVIDEVHERSVDSDLLMALLKPAMTKNSNLKVILMSATIDAERVMNYFSHFADVGSCPRIHIRRRQIRVKLSPHLCLLLLGKPAAGHAQIGI